VQVQKIKEIIAYYKTYLLGKNNREHLYLYDILQNFQEHWGLAKDPLHEMIDKSIESQESRTLWKRANYDPKERMLKFAEINPDFVVHMFRRLFDEDKSIERRVDRFFHASEQMLIELRRIHPTSEHAFPLPSLRLPREIRLLRQALFCRNAAHYQSQ